MENTDPNGNGAEAEKTQGDAAADAQALADLQARHEEELAQLKEQMLRERAEVDNMRKRLQRDAEQARRYANEKVLEDLLEIIDNLERGLGVEASDVDALRTGVQLTLKELLRTADKHGLKIVDPVGQTFNPELHEAMAVVDTADQAPDTVVAVLQKGYTLNDRLLRPALVSVARAPQ